MINAPEYRGIVIGNTWKEENKVAFSKLDAFSRNSATPGSVIGIKYVIKGCEQYTINRKTHSVTDNTFLLVNANQQFETVVKKQNGPTTGLCINIDTELLSEVYQSFTSDDSLLMENPETKKADFNFLATTYRSDDYFSQYLSELKNYLDPFSGELKLAKEELFYSIARNLLISQSLISKHISLIGSNKHHTRQELFRRVKEAKEMIDDCFNRPVEIREIASAVALSEFHFFRVFKQVYGISPYQYQIRKRLEYSRSQLEKGLLSLSEISESSGFGNIQAFSKAFKKNFHVSPGKWNSCSQKLNQNSAKK